MDSGSGLLVAGGLAMGETGVELGSVLDLKRIRPPRELRVIPEMERKGMNLVGLIFTSIVYCRYF